MTSVQQLLDEAFRPPARGIDVRALLRAARRRRRRQRVLTVGLALVAVFGVTAGVLAARAPGGSPRVQTGAAGPTVERAGISLTLRPGWRKLPGGIGVAPSLIVGTAPVPASGLKACGLAAPPGHAAYLFVAAAPTPVGLFFPSGVPAPTASPRPRQFTIENGNLFNCSGNGPGSSTNPSSTPTVSAPASSVEPNHVLEYSFTDGPNTFTAQVLTVGDPNETVLNQGVAILNTLQLAIAGPVQLSGNAPKAPVVLPPRVAPPPADQGGARASIEKAYRVVFETDAGLSDARYLQGAPVMTSTQLQALRARYPGRRKVRIRAFRFVDSTNGYLIFDVRIGRRVIVPTSLGAGVLDHGQGKVSRVTFCAVLSDLGLAPRPGTAGPGCQ